MQETFWTQDASYGDSTQLLYLRARYYNPADGRFQSRDTWSGNVKQPMSYNSWLYTYGNPVNYTDPTGFISKKNAEEANRIVYDLRTYNVFITVDWGEYNTSLNNDLKYAQCDWYEGGWIMPDLKAIQTAVHIMDKGVSYLGGNFKQLIGKAVYVSDKGGVNGKGDGSPGHRIYAGTTEGMTTWRIPNWKSEAYRLYAAVHEVGHIVAFNEKPGMINYYMSELGASCSNQAAYCNTDDKNTNLTYDPGVYAGTANSKMPSRYATHGSYEDFAETWREVVIRAYIRSGDTTYIRQAMLVYKYDQLNHDIGKRRKTMNSIINGSWR